MPAYDTTLAWLDLKPLDEEALLHHTVNLRPHLSNAVRVCPSWQIGFLSQNCFDSCIGCRK